MSGMRRSRIDRIDSFLDPCATSNGDRVHSTSALRASTHSRASWWCRKTIGTCVRIILSVGSLNLRYGHSVAVVWILWLGLAISLSLPLLNWPILFVLAGILIASALVVASITTSKVRPDIAVRPLRYVWGIAGVIGIGILVQIMPLLPTRLDHPIWSAASVALKQPLAGHISVDTAETLLELARYLVVVGVAAAVGTACVDRRISGRMMSGLAWLLVFFTGACFLKTRFHVFQSTGNESELLSDWTNVSLLGVQMGVAVLAQRFQWRWSSSNSFIRRQKERSPPKPPCCRCDDRDFFGAPGCARVRGRRDPDCLRNGDAIDGLIGRTNDVGAERGYVRRDSGALCSLACRDRVRSNCAERGGHLGRSLGR